MKTISKIICAYAFALVSFVSPAQAGSSDFSGIYGALHASINGMSMDGKHVGGSTYDAAGESTHGQVGALVPMAGWEAGFNIPLGDTFFISAGTKWVDGAARLVDAATSGEGSDNGVTGNGSGTAGGENATITISDPREWYIQPSISLFDNSAVYLKYGKVTAKFKTKGTIQAKTGGLSGETYAIGTTTIANNGIFLKTEAGASQYGNIKITNVGDNATSTIEGDPLVAYGSVSIGYKF
jgi:hypothetical protein